MSGAALAVLGAVVGFCANYFIERTKRNHMLNTRWDAPLYELCTKFLAASRKFLHLCSHLAESTDRTEQLKAIDEQHGELRSLFQQVRLIGSPDLQRAGRRIVHHCYSVRRVAQGQPDHRLTDYPGTTPVERVAVATNEFLVAGRNQLGVATPDEVLEDAVITG
jgi:hypothetical protein